ncbi:MAG: hypothetical protein OXC30_02590 [Alphaproteobacteria bacterium]|nr:hypothetical protein [Alphaproteobacteria bacterium]
MKRLVLFFVSTSLLFGAAFNAGKLLLSMCEEALTMRGALCKVRAANLRSYSTKKLFLNAFKEAEPLRRDLSKMRVMMLQSSPSEPLHELEREISVSGHTLLMLGRTAMWKTRFNHINSFILDTCNDLPKDARIECHVRENHFFSGTVIAPASESSSFSFEANAFEEEVFLPKVRFMLPSDYEESAVNFGFINYEHMPGCTPACTVLARYSNGVASAISIPCGKGRIVLASLPLYGEVSVSTLTALGDKKEDFVSSCRDAILKQLYAPLRSVENPRTYQQFLMLRDKKIV